MPRNSKPLGESEGQLLISEGTEAMPLRGLAMSHQVHLEVPYGKRNIEAVKATRAEEGHLPAQRELPSQGLPRVPVIPLSVVMSHLWGFSRDAEPTGHAERHRKRFIMRNQHPRLWRQRSPTMCPLRAGAQDSGDGVHPVRRRSQTRGHRCVQAGKGGAPASDLSVLPAVKGWCPPTLQGRGRLKC